MSAAEIVVTLAGVLLIVATNVYFFAPRRAGSPRSEPPRVRTR